MGLCTSVNFHLPLEFPLETIVQAIWQAHEESHGDIRKDGPWRIKRNR